MNFEHRRESFKQKDVPIFEPDFSEKSKRKVHIYWKRWGIENYDPDFTPTEYCSFFMNLFENQEKMDQLFWNFYFFAKDPLEDTNNVLEYYQLIMFLLQNLKNNQLLQFSNFISFQISECYSPYLFEEDPQIKKEHSSELAKVLQQIIQNESLYNFVISTREETYLETYLEMMKNVSMNSHWFTYCKLPEKIGTLANIFLANSNANTERIVHMLCLIFGDMAQYCLAYEISPQSGKPNRDWNSLSSYAILFKNFYSFLCFKTQEYCETVQFDKKKVDKCKTIIFLSKKIIKECEKIAQLNKV